MKIVVSGVGINSCLGGTQETWGKMSLGLSGIKLAQPFPCLPLLPVGLIDVAPSDIKTLTLSLVEQTLADARLVPPLVDTAVVVGSSRGCQGRWEVLAREYLENNNFSFDWLDTFPCQPSQVTAQYIQCFASVFAPMAACATGLVAIAQGYELIKQGHCQRVIAGAVETPITPLTIVGFQQMKALAHKGCYPFAKEREGMVLGEGGAMLVLETEELALSRGAKIYGEILGWAMSCDGLGMTAPEVSARSAIEAIKRCLNHSNLGFKDIDHIQTHGTATTLNDAREAQIIAKLFPHLPKVNHTKGSVGHTLGGSSAIALALTLISLREQKLLANNHQYPPQYNLNWVKQTEAYNFRNSLCFSFGFGGQNAVVALQKSTVNG